MTNNDEAVDAALDARQAAEDARDAAQAVADLAQDEALISDQQVARGVEAAVGQQKLKDAAAALESDGWTLQTVEPGQITMTGAGQLKWLLHGILALCTLFLSLIWTSKEMKKSRGTLTLTLDQLGRVQQRKS